jgi:hypothetical protein
MYNHFEYGRYLAENLKAIQHTASEPHYFRATDQIALTDLLQRISQASGILLVAWDAMKSGFEWHGSDSLIERPEYAFWLLKQTAGDDIETVFSAQNECRTIAKEIVARMFADSDNYAPNGLNLLDKGSVKLEGIGHAGDNFFGVEISFSFIQGINYQLKPEMWM